MELGRGSHPSCAYFALVLAEGSVWAPPVLSLAREAILTGFSGGVTGKKENRDVIWLQRTGMKVRRFPTKFPTKLSTRTSYGKKGPYGGRKQARYAGSNVIP